MNCSLYLFAYRIWQPRYEKLTFELDMSHVFMQQQLSIERTLCERCYANTKLLKRNQRKKNYTQVELMLSTYSIMCDATHGFHFVL